MLPQENDLFMCCCSFNHKFDLSVWRASTSFSNSEKNISSYIWEMRTWEMGKSGG